MTTHLIPTIILLGCVLSGQAADARAHIAARPLQFSCDMTMTSERGPMTMHMVQDGERKRSELQRGTQTVVMIIRGDQQKMLMVMPERKMIMAMPYDPKKAQDEVEQLSKDSGAKFEAQGSETIRDVVCDKFVTTSSDGKTGTVWIAQEQHTVQRWASGDGKNTVDFSNYQIGPQDAALFEPPAGYQMMTIPAGAPGQPPAK